MSSDDEVGVPTRRRGNGPTADHPARSRSLRCRAGDERDSQGGHDEYRRYQQKDHGATVPGLRLLPTHGSNVPSETKPVVSQSTPFASRDPYVRAAAAAGTGREGRLGRSEVTDLVLLSTDDPDPRVRISALGAIVRGAGRTAAERAWRRAALDSDLSVRRRAAELAPGVTVPLGPLLALAADPEWSVVEAAAWAVGEIAWSATNRGRAVRALIDLTTGHEDPLVREAAVAALGAIGDPAGLAAVLSATRDRPAVRRRAVLALAPFEGAEVDSALEAALTDPDWQVRQAAEDLAP